MSAWGKDKGGALSRTDAESILAFIRTWQKEASIQLKSMTVEGNSENGAQVFERWCAACHGKYGTWGKAVKLGNPVFQQTATDAFIRYAIENGRRNTQMAAYKSILSAGDIDDVISYLRTLNSASTFQETSAEDIEELSNVIREKGVINQGSPPADFTLIDNRFVAADDVNAAYNAGQSFIIIDARPGSDYLRSHITGAISIPFYDIKSAAGLLPKDRWIITYCACPHALSGKAADILKAAGYDKVTILNEGFFYWIDQGYPSESSINSQLKND
jgi:cytochrome c oxidase cbb3-type subunit 3